MWHKKKELKGKRICLSSFEIYYENLYFLYRPHSDNDLFSSDRPFSDSIKQKESGDFACVVCEQKIFSSKSKFESGSGITLLTIDYF